MPTFYTDLVVTYLILDLIVFLEELRKRTKIHKIPCGFYFFIFYYNQLMHNCVIKVYITSVFCVIYTPTCFDTFVSSSESYNQCLDKLHTF